MDPSADVPRPEIVIASSVAFDIMIRPGCNSINGNAVSATRAEQDGNGNNIADTYVKKTDALTGDYLPLSGGLRVNVLRKNNCFV